MEFRCADIAGSGEGAGGTAVAIVLTDLAADRDGAGKCGQRPVNGPVWWGSGEVPCSCWGCGCGLDCCDRLGLRLTRVRARESDPQELLPG